MMLWLVGVGLLVLWFILTFLLHKAGLVHILLICGLSVFVVQITAYRKTKYLERIYRDRR